LLLPQYLHFFILLLPEGKINHTNIQLDFSRTSKISSSDFLFISRGSPLFTAKALGAFLTSPVVLAQHD
jgi:hypothetical protein